MAELSDKQKQDMADEWCRIMRRITGDPATKPAREKLQRAWTGLRTCLFWLGQLFRRGPQ